MKSIRHILLLCLLPFVAWSQPSGINVVQPPQVIDSLGDQFNNFATLSYSRNLFGSTKYYYYRSNKTGDLVVGGGRIGTKSNSIESLSIPTGWTPYQVPCVINDGELLAYWDIGGVTYDLVAQSFNDSLWLTQLSTPGDLTQFAVRGKNILDRGDVTFARLDMDSTSCRNLLAGGNTGTSGLEQPATFTTPPGYTQFFDIDGVTKIYTSGTPPSNDINSTYVFRDGKSYRYDASGSPELVMDLELYEVGGNIFLRDNTPNANFEVSGVNVSNCVIRYFIQGNKDPINNGIDLASGYNVSGWRGRPIQIIKAYVNQSDIGVKQMLSGYVYVPAANNQLETITVIGNDTIFYSPDTYSLPQNGSALATFATTFPDEVHNTGAIKAIFYNNLGDDQADFTRVGLMNRLLGPNGYANLSDAWLYDIGHPRSHNPGYTQQQFNDWYNCCSSGLTSSWNNSVASQNGYGLVMLNDEAWISDLGGMWTSDMYNDVYNLYNSYRTSYPNSQIYPWGVQGYTMQIDKSGNYGTTTVWDQWNHLSTLDKSQFDAQYPCGTGNYGCETGEAEVNVTGMYTVGNYFNSYLETQDMLFDYIHGFILGETYRPGIPGVLNIWTDLETIGDNTQGWISGVNNSGRAWRRNFKPNVFPQDMFNAGAIAGFFHTQGGFIMWDYPNVAYTDNPDDWFDGFYLDDNSNFVSNQNTAPGQLPVRQQAKKSKQHIDEFMKGYWAIMENADLLAGSLDWCEIKVDGTWQSKQNSFYGAAMQYERAFAGIRKVGNNALIYAANFYGTTKDTLEVRFLHNGSYIYKNIPLNANYATIMRVTF